MAAPRIVVFSPDPLLSVAIETRPGGGDEVHLHAAGQGVWVARMAAEMGGVPILCGYAGGETGTVLRGLLDELPIETRLVERAGPTTSYVVDRRSGERTVLAHAAEGRPTRHEVDELLSLTCAAALDADALVVCNPYPGDALPVEPTPSSCPTRRRSARPCSSTSPRRAWTPRSRARPTWSRSTTGSSPSSCAAPSTDRSCTRPPSACAHAGPGP